MYGGGERGIQGFGWVTKGRNHLEDPGIDGRIILRWIFGSGMGGRWTGLIWLRLGTVGRRL